MPAPENILTAEQTCTGLDIEFVRNFEGDFDRLVELLGLLEVSTVAAGTSMFQYVVTGSLNASTPGEGEATPLSLFKTSKSDLGDITPKRYEKGTTLEAILKSGFENAVLKTDKKFAQALRDVIIAQFFGFLANGTGSASGTGLQAALAQSDAVLANALEDNHDSEPEFLHFVNRLDVADYLGDHQVTVENVFGLEYIKDFLGVKNVVRTSKVPRGTVYTTPVGNVHVYGLDFGSLDDAGLTYETDESGLIGVYHKADHKTGTATTFALMGAMFVPEAVNYIVKGTISGSAADGDEVETGDTGDTGDTGGEE